MRRAWLAAALLLAGACHAQGRCPDAAEVTQAHLLGGWHAEFGGLRQGATLLLEQHPEYPEGLHGAIRRDIGRGFVSGEIEDGEFTLEESDDGKRISATWLGQVVEGSCGREIRGLWKRDGEDSGRSFVLRRP